MAVPALASVTGLDFGTARAAGGGVAAVFFDQQVSHRGAYVWSYQSDRK